MNTITVTAGAAQILLDLSQDMIRNRMAVHQVTPDIQAAVKEVADGLAELPEEVAVEVTAEVVVEESAEEVVEAAPQEPASE
jgi:hypothetical protein